VESDVSIQIAVVSGLVDGDGHSGRGNVCRGTSAWFRFGKSMEFRHEFVDIHVEFAFADSLSDVSFVSWWLLIHCGLIGRRSSWCSSRMIDK
jgi:hypothetical protein